MINPVQNSKYRLFLEQVPPILDDTDIQVTWAKDERHIFIDSILRYRIKDGMLYYVDTSGESNELTSVKFNNLTAEYEIGNPIYYSFSLITSTFQESMKDVIENIEFTVRKYLGIRFFEVPDGFILAFQLLDGTIYVNSSFNSSYRIDLDGSVVFIGDDVNNEQIIGQVYEKPSGDLVISHTDTVMLLDPEADLLDRAFTIYSFIESRR